MKSTFYFFIALLIVSSFSLRAQITLEGTIFTDDQTELEGNIRVENITKPYFASPNQLGSFTIKASANDSLTIYSDLYLIKTVIVSKEMIQSKKLIIYLTPDIIHLSATNINLGLSRYMNENDHFSKYKDPITSMYENMGIDPKIRDIVPRENTKKLSPLAYLPLSGMNVVEVLKEISGYKRKLKANYAYDDLEKTLQDIIQYFGEEYFTETLKIPDYKIREFVYYCYKNTQIKTYYKDQSFQLIELELENQHDKYLNLLSLEKDNSAIAN